MAHFWKIRSIPDVGEMYTIHWKNLNTKGMFKIDSGLGKIHCRIKLTALLIWS